MKELKEFTVERLSEIAMDAYEADPSNDEMQSLAKIALTAKQAKPVAITDRGEVYGLAESGWVGNFMPPDYKGVDEGDEVYLYTTPPLNHTEQHMMAPDGWVAIPKEMLADYRDVKNVEIQTYKASFGSHCDIPRSRWQRDLADLTEELEEIDKLIAAPKPESE